MPVHHAISAGDQNEITFQAACSSYGSADALNGQVEIIGSIVGQGRVFDGNASKASLGGEPYGFSANIRRIAKAGFEIT